MTQVPLAPPPPTGGPLDGWLFLLWKRLIATGQLLWSSISFTGSNLTDIETRNHADLKNLNTASYSHLTSTQVTGLTNGGSTTLHTHAGSGGGSVPNVISTPTTIANETSYLVIDHLDVTSELTVEGYLGITDLAVGENGTVTSLTVVSANGLAGTVATATTTPAITLSTSITGLLKGNGTAISAAASGTDYSPPLPAGVIFPYGGSSAPSGWLLCDGSAVSRATYSALFTAISTAFGVGDGSTTFNLPSTARRTLVGAGGSGTATLANTVGSTGGSETHTLTTAELAVHSHGVTDPGHNHTDAYNLTEDVYSSTPKTQTVAADSTSATVTGTNTTGISIANAGSGSAHNNLQPSLVVNYIIKV